MYVCMPWFSDLLQPEHLKPQIISLLFKLFVVLVIKRKPLKINMTAQHEKMCVFCVQCNCIFVKWILFTGIDNCRRWYLFKLLLLRGHRRQRSLQL